MNRIFDFVRGQIYATIMHNQSAIAGSLRSRLLKTNCLIDTGVAISNPKNLIADKKTALYHGTYILNNHGTLKIGFNSHLGARCFVNACYGVVEVGENVAIGPQTQIFSYSNHYEQQKLITNCRITKDVTIGNNVFIGANSSILPGTVIADNVVVGAGSVVSGKLQSDGIYVGSPCRLVKSGWYGNA